MQHQARNHLPIFPVHSMHTPCLLLTVCFPFWENSYSPCNTSSNVTFFKRIPCVPVVSCIYSTTTYILLSLFIGLSPQKGRSFVIFTFPPPTLTTMPVIKFFHSKWLRADCQRRSVEATNPSFDSTLLLINGRTLDKAVNSKRQLLHA